MVYDSMLKLLDFEDMDVFKISSPNEADIERYNATFDYVFLRGSNFIHEHMRWENAIWILERLKIPVFAIGVGAQAETKRKITLPEDSLRVWKLISERSTVHRRAGHILRRCSRRERYQKRGSYWLPVALQAASTQS